MIVTRTAKAITQNQLDQREALWPKAEPRLWHRKVQDGFTTVSKTMPLILQITDEMSKGKPLSPTYLSLWCATWDDSFVNISKPLELAHTAGFSGQSAEYTWSARMKLLQELGFLDIEPGKSGAISHVIIWSTQLVIREHHEKRTPGLVEATYNMLLDRAIEIGAKDALDSSPPTPPPAAVAAVPSAAPAPASPLAAA